MKKFWAFLALVIAFSMPFEAAHAKRFGGGKSFGRTYNTTPYSPVRATPAPTQPQKGMTTPAGAGKGMLGGLLGGLLAGGLIAALFAGGAFNGLQMTDVLLIGAAIFAVMFLLRRMRASQVPRPAYAGVPGGARDQVHGQARDAMTPPVFGQRTATAATEAPVPMNLPHGFDSPAFLEGAKNHYRILQDAWNRNDLVKIREYCEPDLYDLLRVERAGLAAEQHTEVLALNTELVRADQSFGMAEVSIRFSGRYRDAVEGVEEDFTDIWHLARDCSKDDAPWLITGVESV